MKYLNASFSIYSHMAYGDTIGENDENREGVLDGVCHSTDAVCRSSALLGDISFAFPNGATGTPTGVNDNERKQNLAGSFYADNILPAFSQLPSELQINIFDSSEETRGTCKRPAGSNRESSFECDSDAVVEITRQISGRAQAGEARMPGSDVSVPYTYLDDPTLTFKIVDFDPSFRVKKDAPNEFCTRAILKYAA